MSTKSNHKPTTLRICSRNANGRFVALTLEHELITRRLSDGSIEGLCSCGDWDATSGAELFLRNAFEGHVKKACEEEDA